MMFRSLAISTSLLALLASGSVMAMEDRDENDRKRNGGAQDSPLGNSSKRVKQEEAKEEKPQPQAINKELNDMIDAAKQGDVKSQYKLGKVYYEGKGVDQDFKEAKKLWEDAAKQGDVESQYKLGKMYYEGKGVDQDFKEAKKLWEDAAKGGHKEAQYQFGKMLVNGIKDENGQEIVKRDSLRAMELFEEVAMTDGFEDLGAQCKLGKMLRDGVKDENGQEIIKRDSLRAKDWFEESAKWGDPSAEYKLGEMLRDGVKDENGQEIIKRDLPEAVGWFILAFRSGYKNAPFQLKECMKLLEVAAQDGNPDAQLQLGAVLKFGEWDGGQEIIKRDPLEAIKWFKAAAQNGNPDALLQLGWMLLDGVQAKNGQEIVKRDLLGAKKYLEDAAKGGHKEAQYQFGKMLVNGIKDENGQEIVKKDRLNAIKWLKAAADRGHEKAKVELQQLRPAVPAAVQQNTFDVRSTWKFNPAELRNATEDEIKLYDEIIGKIEESSITPAEKVKAKNALLRFKTLHANNTAICAELMESPVVRNYSEKIYAVTPRDILIHPEQGDANLEQRAHIIHNILETTYAGVKETPISLEKFFKEAFSDTIPCLEAQSRKIDDWRASQESIEVKISRQTIVQNIGEDANQLLEEMKKNSETGKKVIEATQDYQMLDMKLLGAPPEIRKASLKHTSQNIARLEKKHEKWLKNNNKYGEMRQSLLSTLVGKRAQDGEITENTLNDILSGLGWDFDPQG